MARQATPSDIHPCLAYDDAPQAIDWLCRAFGFKKRLIVPGPDGSVLHAELSLGTGVIMVGSAKPADARISPLHTDGQCTQMLSVYVPDPDAHHQTAMAAGARPVRPLQDEEYGARGYMVRDLEGHLWYFGNYRPGGYWDEDPPQPEA